MTRAANLDKISRIFSAIDRGRHAMHDMPHVRLLQPYSRESIEPTTGFFRYPAMLGTVADRLERQPLKTGLKVLFAACAIGCDAYSFAALASRRGLYDRCPGLRIDAQDISPVYTDIARAGYYPPHFFSSLRPVDCQALLGRDEAPDILSLFNTPPLLPVCDAVHDKVRFLDAQPLESFHAPTRYNVVVATNLLLHFREERRAMKILQRAAALASDTLCLNWRPIHNNAVRHYLHGQGFAEQTPPHAPVAIFTRAPALR